MKDLFAEYTVYYTSMLHNNNKMLLQFQSRKSRTAHPETSRMIFHFSLQTSEDEVRSQLADPGSQWAVVLRNIIKVINFNTTYNTKYIL